MEEFKRYSEVDVTDKEERGTKQEIVDLEVFNDNDKINLNYRNIILYYIIILWKEIYIYAINIFSF